MCVCVYTVRVCVCVCIVVYMGVFKITYSNVLAQVYDCTNYYQSLTNRTQSEEYTLQYLKHEAGKKNHKFSQSKEHVCIWLCVVCVCM